MRQLPVKRYPDPDADKEICKQAANDTTEHAMERAMLGRSRRDKMRNADINHKTGITDIIDESRRLSGDGRIM
jgi:hypothetical protein